MVQERAEIMLRVVEYTVGIDKRLSLCASRVIAGIFRVVHARVGRVDVLEPSRKEEGGEDEWADVTAGPDFPTRDLTGRNLQVEDHEAENKADDHAAEVGGVAVQPDVNVGAVSLFHDGAEKNPE